METREDYARGVFEFHRRNFLRDMNVRDLQDLIEDKTLIEPEDESSDLYQAVANYKEHLIDIIIEGYLDSQVNPEVR